MRVIVASALVAVFLLIGAPVFAQSIVTGNITADSGAPAFTDADCPSSSGACVVATYNRLQVGSAAFRVSNTFTSQLNFEAKVNSVWSAITAYPDAAGAGVTSTGSTGLWHVNLAGTEGFRVRARPYTSGTAAIAINPSPLGWTQPAGATITSANITDRSGSISSGGTAQTAISANASRVHLVIQNYSTAALQGVAAAESLFVSFTGTALCSGGANTFEIPPGGSIETGGSTPVSTQAVSVCAASTGHLFAAGEQ